MHTADPHLLHEAQPCAFWKLEGRFQQIVITLNVGEIMRNKWRDNLESKIGSGMVLVGANFGFNALSYLFVLFMGWKLDVSEFGGLAVFSSLLMLISLPGAALFNTTSRYVAVHDRNNHKNSFVSVMKVTDKVWKAMTVSVVILYLILSPILMMYFRLSSWLVMISFMLVLMSVFGLFWVKAVLHGLRKYQVLSAVLLIEGVTKILVGLLLVGNGLGLIGAILALGTSLVVPLIYGWMMVKNYIVQNIQAKRLNLNRMWGQIGEFLGHNILSSLGLMLLVTVDMLMVKHLLSPEDAGRYAVLTLFGKIVIMGASALSGVMLPYIARAKTQKQDLVLSQLGLALVGSYVALVVGGLNIYPEQISQLLLGTKGLAIAVWLPKYALAVGLMALASFWVNIALVKREFSVAKYPLIFSLILIGGLNYSKGRIDTVVQWYLWVALGFFGLMLIRGFYKRLTWQVKDLRDLWSSLDLPSAEPLDGGKKRILILNWRDTKHIWSGGAEVYVHELAKRWVQKNHQVVLFCGHDRKTVRDEVIDGVKIIRRGGFGTVYFWAWIYYWIRLRGRFDVIVDSENGVPFFTPLYSRLPIVLVIHHVHQEVFRENLIKPLAILAMFLEGKLMPLLYQNKKIVTVSESSRREIIRCRLSKRRPTIVSCGINEEVYSPGGTKSKNPLIAYIGRLKGYKSLPVLLVAAKTVVDTIPTAKFIIAGDGEERSSLEADTNRLGLSKKVKFTGFVSEAEKVRIYRKAWLTVNTSFMEGWGITSVEANACGTPIVASNVPGLRDSVVDGNTGMLVTFGDSQELAEKIVEVIQSKKLRYQMSKKAIAFSARYNWGTSASEFMKVIDREIKSQARSQDWSGEIVRSFGRFVDDVRELVTNRIPALLPGLSSKD